MGPSGSLVQFYLLLINSAGSSSFLCHNNPEVNTIHHWDVSMSSRSHQISVFILPIETLTSHLSTNVNTFTRHRGNQADQVFWPANPLTQALDLGSAVSSGRTFGKIQNHNECPSGAEKGQPVPWMSSTTDELQDQCWTLTKVRGGRAQISTVWVLRGLIYPNSFFVWVLFTHLLPQDRSSLSGSVGEQIHLC